KKKPKVTAIMMGQHDCRDFRIFLYNFLHHKTELKTGAHPFHIIHFAAENFLRQFFAIRRSCNRDDGVRMHVIHELSRNETMQWRVNGTGAWIQIEYRVIVSRY